MSKEPIDSRSIRREYEGAQLHANDLQPDPHAQLCDWLAQAVEAQVTDATAMTLATATPDGWPSARIVLLKGTSDAGLQFFTDYESEKGQVLESNPRAAVVFYWRELNRQLRVSGTITKLSRAASCEYFDSRPSLSRYAAAASHQSRPIGNRQELETRMQQLIDSTAEETPLQTPARWGGYHLHPSAYEFWQGRENRLHDRFSYTLQNEVWLKQRLQP